MNNNKPDIFDEYGNKILSNVVQAIQELTYTLPPIIVSELTKSLGNNIPVPVRYEDVNGFATVIADKVIRSEEIKNSIIKFAELTLREAMKPL
jgi:hypothetical protein